MKKIRIAIGATLIGTALTLASPLFAATPREILTQASFLTTDKQTALALINKGLAAAEAESCASAARNLLPLLRNSSACVTLSNMHARDWRTCSTAPKPHASTKL